MCVADGDDTAEHLTVAKMLMNAGADPAHPIPSLTDGYTTVLRSAAYAERSGGVRVLLEAGANPNSRADDGATPLYLAAQEGHLLTVKTLLGAKADPLIARKSEWLELTVEAAAVFGHAGVVHELIRQVGIEGCDDESGGVAALEAAAMMQHLNVMAVLMDAGVVDSGLALIGAVARGNEEAVKFLLRQKEGETSDDQAAYVNYHTSVAGPALMEAVSCRSPRPRVFPLLVDHGADTTTPARVLPEGRFRDEVVTPLDITSCVLLEKKATDGKDATEEQLLGMDGIRRVLLRVEAARAVSLLWPDTPTTTADGAAQGTSRTETTTSAQLTRMLPILRRRARRPRVLLAALLRWAV